MSTELIVIGFILRFTVLCSCMSDSGCLHGDLHVKLSPHILDIETFSSAPYEILLPFYATVA